MWSSLFFGRVKKRRGGGNPIRRDADDSAHLPAVENESTLPLLTEVEQRAAPGKIGRRLKNSRPRVQA